jgi:hypothetical protein
MNSIKISRFAQTAKFRIISGNVSFLTTAKMIRSGVGEFAEFNAAVQKSLDALEYQRSCSIPHNSCSGISGIWQNIPVQIDVR